MTEYAPTAHDLALIADVEARQAERERKLQAEAWDAGALWRHRASGSHTNGRSWFQHGYPQVPQFARNPYRGAKPCRCTDEFGEQCETESADV